MNFSDYPPEVKERAQAIRLLILDVDMPAGGGQKVFDRMRNLFQDATPILFSTGMPESVDALAKNMNVMVLKKPVKPDEIIAAAKKLLKID